MSKRKRSDSDDIDNVLHKRINADNIDTMINNIIAGNGSVAPTSLTLYPALTNIVNTTPITKLTETNNEPVLEHVLENASHLGTMLDSLNDEMKHTDGILTKKERQMLTENLVKKIRDAITIKQQMVELENEGMGVDAMKQIFHGLIEYYTSLAYYGYEQAPEVLTKIAALLAGSAIIGATINNVSSSSSSAVSSAISLASQGELLSLLSNYLPSTASYATGIYLLKRGGMPFEKMAEQAVSCVEGGCEQLLNSASTTIQKLLESDDYSVASSSSSGSIISRVNESIDSMFAEIDNYEKERVGNSQNSDLSDLTWSQDLSQDLSQDSPGSGSFFSARNSPQPQSFSPEPLLSSQGTIHTGDVEILSDNSTQKSTGTEKGGKRKGKSRRHTKFRKTKRHMKKHHRLTKKGKKHYKTLKRYRRKMRR